MFVCSICTQNLTDDSKAGDYPDHDPICFGCLATTEEKMDGVEVLYRSRNIEERNQTAIRGYHIHQIVKALEQARQLQASIKSVIVIDGKGGTRLFVPEKDQ